MFSLVAQGPRLFGRRLRRLFPRAVRQAGARLIASRRAGEVERRLRTLADDSRPIVVGPWLGEVGFELLYWVPFVRWFAHRYSVPAERLIVVTRGGAATWYASLAARSHDVLALMSQEEFRRRNAARAIELGEQKQIAPTRVEQEIVEEVKAREGCNLAVLHPSVMYRLFAPYWWGHEPMEWVHRYAEFSRLGVPDLDVPLPPSYTAVKFYFNDCFADSPQNRAFVSRTIDELAKDGPVISLSTGVAVDEHHPCEPDVAAIHPISHLLTPETNLAVQSAIVGGAARFVGTYGGFAYLAPFYGVPSIGYYTHAEGFSRRHLDLMQDVLRRGGAGSLLDVRDAERRG